MQNKFEFMQGFRFNIQKFKNLTYFAFLIEENNFLRKLQLAKLFSMKFSVDWYYFFTILKQKIQTSLIITTITCTRIHIFKCIYPDGENDSDDAVKTKNAPFFINFPNINKNGQLFSHWTGPLSQMMVFSITYHRDAKHAIMTRIKKRQWIRCMNHQNPVCKH